MSIDLIEVEAKGQAEVFLRTLFEPDDIVEIRPIETYRDDNGAKQSRVATQFRSWGTIDEVLGKFEQLQDANRRQHLCIFFGVNPRTQRGGGTKTDVSLIRALYVDVDGVKPEAALHQLEDAGLPSPNIVLNSGHGTHFYWVLAEPFELVTPEDRDRVEILLKGLCGMLDGGDTKAGEIARILRIPGFQNMKFARNGEPATPCFLHRPINDHYYDIAELEEYLTPSDPPRIAPNNGDGAEVIDAGGRRARCLKAMLAIRVNGETDGSNRLFSYACRAVEFDLADADAIGIIREYERHRPFPKAYSDAEITNRLRHAERRVTRGSAKGKTRVSSTAPKIEPHKSFPVDALPEPVRSFVTNGAKAIGCALCFLALPLLAALASAIGNARRIQLKRGWVEPPILWTAIIGESGTQKTPAFSLVLRPLRELQSKALAENAERMGNFERERLEYDVRLKKWKHKPEGDPPEAPEEPQPARFIVNDSTIEALATILASNPRGVLLARDELAGWMDSFDRYANGKGGGDAAHWLSIHRAEAITMDRKTGQRIIHVPRPAVSIAGGIQPRILARSVQGRHRENGLAARLLMASPPPKAKRWTEADIPPESEAQLAILFDRLLELRPNVFDGEPEPVIIPLDTEAKKLWVPFYNEHNEEQADMTGDLAAAWSKLEAYAPRLALVIHCVRWAADDRSVGEAVDAESMAAGIALAKWFGHEARRIYAMLDEDDEDRDRRRLIEWIERKGGAVTTRDSMRSGPCYQTKADAEVALDVLADVGLGAWEISASGSTGGRPTRRFVLSKPPDPTDTDENPRDDPESGGWVSVSTVSECEVDPDPDGKWGEI